MGLCMQRSAAILMMSVATFVTAQPASAYLYWTMPDLSGPPVRGDEQGIFLPMPGARPAEIQANMVWTLRAALNVAALQCQFSTPLRTVPNYNTLLSQHKTELAGALTAITAYFKRVQPKSWQRAVDSHTTRIYNGMSTMHAQLSFCETASKIGRIALSEKRGSLYQTAGRYMSEVRNSLIPVGDRMFAFRPGQVSANFYMPPLNDACWDGRGNLTKKCWPRA